MLTIIVGVVCIFAGGAGGYLLGAKVKAKAQAVVQAVEAAGASLALTDAVTLLGKARERVADHEEGLP